MPTADGALAVARELADEVLFQDAMRVDGLGVLPVAHLDALAARCCPLRAGLTVIRPAEHAS